VRGVQLEDGARHQLENVARLPVVFHHVAAMPDVHWGIGATVGSVIPTERAIIPAAVGVDTGCGMMAVETTMAASQPPTRQVPRPRSRRPSRTAAVHGRKGDRGGAAA
jgi:tRNA-splicing ligase RtcB